MIVSWPLPRTTVGAAAMTAGGPTGFADAVPAGPVPRSFTARTSKVYVVPLVRPVTFRLV